MPSVKPKQVAEKISCLLHARPVVLPTDCLFSLVLACDIFLPRLAVLQLVAFRSFVLFSPSLDAFASKWNEK